MSNISKRLIKNKMWWSIAIFTIIVGISKCRDLQKTYIVQDEYGPLSKIQVSDEEVYIGGKNIFLHLDSELQPLQTDSIGPVNNSLNCKPFDRSCILAKYETVDNDVSLLLPYKSYLFLCGTAHQGLCYRYNRTDIRSKTHFKLKKKNLLGSKNSSVMLASQIDETSVFFVGQSYDGRNEQFFNKEFITLDLNEFGESWDFQNWAASSFLSVCATKRNSFKLKFLYIFETEDHVFHVFMRSINKSGNLVYETRISSICKREYTYSSYEEMVISCKKPAKYDIGLAAHFDGNTLLMTFGIRAHHLGLFEADVTQGSVLCAYNKEELQKKFNSEVLTKCYHGEPTYGSPSWQCDNRSCTVEGVPSEKNKIVISCNQTKMPYGIEARGDGYSQTASYTLLDDLMTAIYPLRNVSMYTVVVGSSKGFIRKVLIPTNGRSRVISKFDVSRNPDIPVNKEMVMDSNNYLYVLTGNKVTKLSMTSCELHQSCGQCVTSNDPLGCGWCYDKCLTKMECLHSWHNESCPPFIHQIKPSTGPVDGGTKLVIIGENFGNSSYSVIIKIGESICSTQTCNNSMITCNTGKVVTETSETVHVSVSTTLYRGYKINGTSEQKNFTFDYKTYSIDQVFPLKGPKSGNVVVTIIGENLDIGSNTSVNFGSAKCHITSVNSSMIKCRTSSCNYCADRNAEYRGTITLQIDNATFTPLKNGTFILTPDPKVIPPLSRTSSIISGGLDIQVSGNWFESLSSQVMQFNIGGDTVNTSCESKSDFLLVCRIPDLSSLTNTTVNADRSLLFNGIMPYKDTMMVYHDPELFTLATSSNIKHIDLQEKVLELKGNSLSLSLKKEDYTVTINGSKCPVKELNMNYLRCNLSSTVYIKDIPLPVEVSAGYNWKTKLGHIKFEHVEHRPYHHLIPLFSTASGVLVVCIFIIVVIMKRKHLGMFRKKVIEFSVAYHPADTNDREDDNENADRPRYVRPEEQERQPSTSDATDGDFLKTAFDACEITDMLKRQNIYIERDLVELGEDIGHGNFGCVYKGFLNRGEKKTVAIKTILKAGCQDVNSFLDEAIIMKDFEHPNVLSLIGISVASGEFPLVILPFMANGDLLSYIRNEANKPTVKDLVRFGLDVGNGMEYLGSIKFVHRDLAARNCMLDEDHIAKVADFGLARDIYTKNYYSSDNKKMLPVKWMAPESLENGTYGIKSDVWSFGVVMWELMTRGAAPYADVDNWDMLHYLQTGRRLKRPNFCPPKLYDIMCRCWEFELENRPSFHLINQRITELVES